MKVFEIISEAPNFSTQPVPGSSSGLVMPAGAKTAAPLPQAAPTTPPKTPNAAAQANKAIQQQVQNISDLHKKITQTISGAPKRSQKMDALWKQKYGTLLTVVMRIVGIAGALTDLYTELDLADEIFKNGEVSESVLKEYREWSFGRFATQVLTPAVAKVLGKAIGVSAMVRWIKNAVAVAGAGVSLGASAAAAFASEAFFIWLQRWLASPQATEWLTNGMIMPIVKTMGTVPETAWSELTGYYEKAQKSSKPAAPSVKAEPGSSDAEKLIKKLDI